MGRMTPEQIHERDKRDEAAAAETRLRHQRVLEAAAGNVPLMAVVEHHKPVIRGGYRECWGCDAEGTDAVPPDYPCSTIELLEEHYHLTT